MNQKFYNLTEEKQQRIIRAGYHVFAAGSYRKCPVSEVADAAGISKSLLFFYFQNKKEFYLFLWKEAMRLTVEAMQRHYCYETTGFFEMMERGLRAKIEIMRVYPDIVAFTLRVFYEKDEEVREEIRKSYQDYKLIHAAEALMRVNPGEFRQGVDLEMMYRDMFWASEGYLWEVMQRGEPVDLDGLERDFWKMLNFWKQTYARKPEKTE